MLQKHHPAAVWAQRESFRDANYKHTIGNNTGKANVHLQQYGGQVRRRRSTRRGEKRNPTHCPVLAKTLSSQVKDSVQGSSSLINIRCVNV